MQSICKFHSTDDYHVFDTDKQNFVTTYPIWCIPQIYLDMTFQERTKCPRQSVSVLLHWFLSRRCWFGGTWLFRREQNVTDRVSPCSYSGFSPGNDNLWFPPSHFPNLIRNTKVDVVQITLTQQHGFSTILKRRTTTLGIEKQVCVTRGNEDEWNAILFGNFQTRICDHMKSCWLWGNWCQITTWNNALRIVHMPYLLSNPIEKTAW